MYAYRCPDSVITIRILYFREQCLALSLNVSLSLSLDDLYIYIIYVSFIYIYIRYIDIKISMCVRPLFKILHAQREQDDLY